MTGRAFYSEFGRLLQEARRIRKPKITQARLAAAVGLSRSSVANIEMGRQPVQLHVAVKLAEAIGVPVIDLLPKEGAVTVAKEIRIAVEALRQQGASPQVRDRILARLPSRES